MLEGYKTYIGIGITVVGMLSNQLKLGLLPAETEAIVNGAFMVIGTIIAIIGRAKVKPK